MKKISRNIFSLKERVVIITGGAGLLGEKHAEAIAEFGGIPVLLDVNFEEALIKADKVAKKYDTICKAYHCDITDLNNISKTKNSIVEKFGRIDVLINNAAIDPKMGSDGSGRSFSRLEFFSLLQWNQEINVGLTGAFLCTKVFGSYMAENSGGTIINISSDLGIIAPDQRLYRKEKLKEEAQAVKPITYSVIKHGLIGLTKYTATYWVEKGVRANALCPAGVYTNQADEFVQKISNLIPMGRMANVDEYKGAIVFLASDASSYMNGAILIIDGGRTIW